MHITYYTSGSKLSNIPSILHLQHDNILWIMPPLVVISIIKSLYVLSKISFPMTWWFMRKLITKHNIFSIKVICKLKKQITSRFNKIFPFLLFFLDFTPKYTTMTFFCMDNPEYPGIHRCWSINEIPYLLFIWEQNLNSWKFYESNSPDAMTPMTGI